jgi:hypothetical protein
MKRWMAAGAILLLATGGAAYAAKLCASRGGGVHLRTTCRPTETAVDTLSDLGVQACGADIGDRCISEQHLNYGSLVDPNLSALVAGAFCQAKVDDIYGGCEVYGVSRVFEAPGSDSCEAACAGFGASNSNDPPGSWHAAVHIPLTCGSGGTNAGAPCNTDTDCPGSTCRKLPVGTADMGALFRVDVDNKLQAVGGRPFSGFLQADVSNADWCCCTRGCPSLPHP